MTRGNFDPNNPDREPGARGGLDRFLAPPGHEESHMPADAIDGKADAEAEAPQDNELSHEARDPDDAARSLEEMTEPHPGEEGTTSRGAL